MLINVYILACMGMEELEKEEIHLCNRVATQVTEPLENSPAYLKQQLFQISESQQMTFTHFVQCTAPMKNY